ncbi:hypothetical protein L226DRAFT_299605 [Lentinus tigrinus ALCF2SS1-7]|uniref:uncharacterized protein n=1 Tax=Lentinus tigrinus ALCF2SS1-7 TaxID=1328758 RepID=UPI001165EB4D|nr:hypothetical protein L226DRAFT_299605 [Lentinus tigrinus ALCF2SS1-7]
MIERSSLKRAATCSSFSTALRTMTEAENFEPTETSILTRALYLASPITIWGSTMVQIAKDAPEVYSCVVLEVEARPWDLLRAS